MINDEIISRLFELRDEAYREFQSKLIPTVDIGDFIGVRTPELRAFAAELAKRDDKEIFLSALPHRYFDEYQLHAFTVSLEKDFEKCVEEVERLLPYVDNWAVCDQTTPKAFKKHRSALLPHIEKWLPAAVADIRSEDYYVNMMRAWYFATALAKQYESTLPFFTGQRLDKRTHNKAIQKAVESRRVPDETKLYLKTLKIK